MSQQTPTQYTAACAERTVTMGSSSFGMWKNAIIRTIATRMSCRRLNTMIRLEAIWCVAPEGLRRTAHLIWQPPEGTE